MHFIMMTVPTLTGRKRANKEIFNIFRLMPIIIVNGNFRVQHHITEHSRYSLSMEKGVAGHSKHREYLKVISNCCLSIL